MPVTEYGSLKVTGVPVAVPPGVVSVALTAPFQPTDGVTALTWVSETTVKLLADVEPNFTAVVRSSAVPVIVTVVSALRVTVFGDTDEMVGRAT